MTSHLSSIFVRVRIEMSRQGISRSVQCSVLVTDTPISWTLGSEHETLVLTVFICSGLACYAANGCTFLRASTHGGWTIGRKSEAVGLAPFVDTGDNCVGSMGNTHLGSYNQRERKLRCNTVRTPSQSRGLRIDKLWRQPSRTGDYLDIRTVTECLRFTASNRFGTVVTATTHVPSIISPLNNTLAASQVRG
uniref:Uncharacterized protein n=1 Tax=Cacopsylla melanoneura TaxID=428564 RepID=A0A8D8Z5X3_9HEMI